MSTTLGVTEPSKGRVGVDNGLVKFAALGHDLAVPELDQLGFHGALLEPVDGVMVNWIPSVRAREKGRHGAIVLELHVEFVAVRPGHHWAACERAATGRGIYRVPYSKGSCPLE